MKVTCNKNIIFYEIKNYLYMNKLNKNQEININKIKEKKIEMVNKLTVNE